MTFGVSEVAGRVSLKRHAIVGSVAVLVLFGGLIAWGAQTKVASAVVASGAFVITGDIKAIQHPTGGTISTLRVAEGDEVSAGQVLATIEGSELSAEVFILQSRLDGASIKQARLIAERDHKDAITVPSGSSVSDFGDAIREESELMTTRASIRSQQVAQVDAKIGAGVGQIEALNADLVKVVATIAVKDAEMAAVSASGETPVSIAYQLSSLQQQRSALEGERTVKETAITQASTDLSVLRLQRGSVFTSFQAAVLEELGTVGQEIREFQAQLDSSSTRADDLSLLAPESGVVHKLAIHNSGAVLAAGQIAMYVVPLGSQLEAEVRIAPTDVDNVIAGEKVLLQLSGLNRNTTPELSGTVEWVSPTVIIDQLTGASYFSVRVGVDDDELKESGLSAVLKAGMPVDAFIQTGDRTVLSYLVKPLTDQISRAFREG